MIKDCGKVFNIVIDGHSNTLTLSGRIAVLLDESGAGKTLLTHIISEPDAHTCTVTGDFNKIYVGKEESMSAPDGSLCLLDEDDWFMDTSKDVMQRYYIVITREFKRDNAILVQDLYSIRYPEAFCPVISKLPVSYWSGESVDYIITESAKDKSEHKLLTQCTYLEPLLGCKILAAGGRTHFYKQLKSLAHNSKCLLFIDLCKAWNVVSFITKQCIMLGIKVYFYPYLSFEELILATGFFKINTYAQLSTVENWEKFTADILEYVSRDTPYFCKHKPSMLSDCYLKSCNQCCEYSICGDKLAFLFDTLPGKELYEYVLKHNDE